MESSLILLLASGSNFKMDVNMLNRREFIKKSVQFGGGSLVFSMSACQGSWLDPFANPVDEVIVTERTASGLYKMNLSSGKGELIYTFPTQLYGVALYNSYTLLVTEDAAGGILYKVDLRDNSVTTLLSAFAAGNSLYVVMENSNSAIIGDTLGNLYRIDLASLSVSTLASGLGGSLSGIAIENSSSVLILDYTGGNLYRVSLSDGSYGSPLNIGAATTFSHVAISTNRNIAYISNNVANQIKRVDLSSFSLLSDIAFSNAGEAIALENNNFLLVGNTGGTGLYRVNIDSGQSSRVDDGFLTGLTVLDLALRFK